MTTVPTGASASIDITSLMALRVEVDEMTRRLSFAADTPAEDVYLDLERRCDAVEGAFADSLLALIGDLPADYRASADDAVHEIAALLTGSLPLDALADEAYRTERADRSALHMLQLLSDRGASEQNAFLASVLAGDNDLSPAGRAACEAFIAEASS